MMAQDLHPGFLWAGLLPTGKLLTLNSFQKCQKGFSNVLQARTLDVNPWRFKAAISGSCCACPSWDLGRGLGEKGQLAGPFKLSQQGTRGPGGPWSWSPQTFPSVFAILPSPSVFFARDGAGQSPKGCLAKSSDMGQFLVTSCSFPRPHCLTSGQLPLLLPHNPLKPNAPSQAVRLITRSSPRSAKSRGGFQTIGMHSGDLTSCSNFPVCQVRQ